MKAHHSGAERKHSLHSCSFRAMNTQIEVLFQASGDAAPVMEETAEAWFRSAEERFSRFLPSSELSHLNRLAGERCLVSDAMLEVLRLAEAYLRKTNGIFNPFLLPSLERLGYGETFDRIRERKIYPIPPSSAPAAGPVDFDIDPLMKSVLFPAQAKLDLGGIVKSWSVRRLADYMQAVFGLSRGLINAGGDLVAWGGSSDPHEPWLIGIEDPWRPEQDAGVLAIEAGAAATSGTLGRRWATDRGPMHHLLDPRRGVPSDSGVVQCTVSGPDPVECEIWAKTICIAGLEEGLTLMNREARPAGKYEALIFCEDRRIIFAGDPSSLQHKWRGVPVASIESGRRRPDKPQLWN
jgi:thiamine biosynthesis lipoprotein